MNRKDKSAIFSERYWKRVFLRVLMISLVLSIIITVLGVLAIPVIMSLIYSWFWMFLYVLYAYVLWCAVSYLERGGAN